MKSLRDPTGKSQVRTISVLNQYVGNSLASQMAASTAGNVVDSFVRSIQCIRSNCQDRHNMSRLEDFGAEFVKHVTNQGRATMIIMVCFEVFAGGAGLRV